MAKVIEYQIIISQNAGATEKRSAALLQEKIKLICGTKIPVLTDETAPSPLEIVVGQTNREALDGLSFQRAPKKLWEYALLTVGSRFYITGLGVKPEPAPFLSSYEVYNDGQIGTAHGVYVFIEKILGYDMMFSGYCDLPEKPELEMPENYRHFRTAEALQAQLPEKPEGASVHFIPSCTKLEWQMTSIIFRTASGKLIVVDGGRIEDTEHVLQALEHLSDGKKPVVSAWLLSHMHDDHFGFYVELCENPALRDRVTVEHFYCNLLSEEFYLKTSQECDPRHGVVRNLLLDPKQNIAREIHTVQTGDVITVDEFAFEVLHVPSEDRATDMNMNDSSVVYKLNYNDQQTIMLLGDAEWVCSNDLVENQKDKLKSDVVQVSHHGCGNVSEECYKLIDAKYYIWQVSPRFWYSDGGSGLNTRNTGVSNTFLYIGEAGGKAENFFRDMEGIVSLSLPIEK